MKNVAKFLLVTLITLLTLEVLLRLTAPYLGSDVCNELYRTYSNDKGGIYYCEALSRCYFCLPNDHRRAAVNGYQWLHETDERGFRNPPGTEHEILILGDSFIYGHGVNEPQTAASLLRNHRGWKIYNLARQGDSLWQHYILFRLWEEQLRPKHIILCVFGNDFKDIEFIHPAAELKDPPELKPGFIEQVRKNLGDPGVRYQFGNWLSNSYTYRLGLFVRRRWNRQTLASQGPTQQQLQTTFDQTTVYYTLVFQDLVKRCQQRGYTLDVVFINTGATEPAWKWETEHIQNFVADLCARNHVHFCSTRDILADHPELTLPNDGHLNAKGNQVLADFIASQCQPGWK
ncbi:SGNH/GDSL hydrolase family protein [bacterium]|nr:SGNH/GDSL hydrolase family protein [bacterium]